MSKTAPIIPSRVREFMEACEHTQSSLARTLGVDQTLINKIINGKTLFTSHLNALAVQLGTTPAYLTGETDDPELGALPIPTPELIAEQLDAVEITEIDLKFGMGGGTDLEVPTELNKIVFSRSWIKNFTNSSPDKLFFAKGIGDSMQPTIYDGDIVLIDTNQTQPRMQDQIWAITQYNFGMIKRLRGTEDGYKIMSDNPNVSDDTAHDGSMHVIGRVIAIVRRV